MSRPKRILRWSLITLAVLALAGGSYYYWSSSRNSDEPAVQTARVERGNLEVTAQSSGNVEADLTVEVKSRASGEVVELKVDAGDTVRAGDLLVRLDPVDEDRNVEDAQASATSSDARVAQARSSLASARAQRQDALSQLARRRAAHASGLISAEELQSAVTSADVSARTVESREADVRSASADLGRARLSIDEARRRREETVIRAPVDGTVLSVNVDRGAIIASGISNVGGGTTLLTLADLSRLLVSVQLDEAQIGSVRKGQEARIRVDAHPDIVFRGEVERVSPLGVTTANIVTFDVRVLVTDRRAYLLRPGMSTDVEIVTEHRENVLLVPSAALRRMPTRGRGAGTTGAGTTEVPRESRAPRDAGAMGQASTPRDSADSATRDAARSARSSGASDSATPGPQERRGPRVTRAIVQLVSGDTRIVVTGPSSGSNTVIEEGLNEGDEIVVSSGASRTSATNGAARSGSSPFTPPRR